MVKNYDVTKMWQKILEYFCTDSVDESENLAVNVSGSKFVKVVTQFSRVLNKAERKAAKFDIIHNFIMPRSLAFQILHSCKDCYLRIE